jgi:hypothetical protein
MEDLTQAASLIGGGGSFLLMLVFILRVFRGLLESARSDAETARGEATRLRIENDMLRKIIYDLHGEIPGSKKA